MKFDWIDMLFLYASFSEVYEKKFFESKIFLWQTIAYENMKTKLSQFPIPLFVVQL